MEFDTNASPLVAKDYSREWVPTMTRQLGIAHYIEIKLN